VKSSKLTMLKGRVRQGNGCLKDENMLANAFVIKTLE
jgi:hypothetical protein